MPYHHVKSDPIRRAPTVNLKQPSASVKSRLKASIPSDFHKQVTQQQINSGYQPDNWRQAPLGEIRLNNLDVRRHTAFASSLLHGASSLWLPEQDISDALIDRIEEVIKKSAYPKGTTNYFGDLSSLRTLRIHDKSPGVSSGSEEPNYHQLVQVAKKYCPDKSSRDTLVALREHKDTVGIFNKLPEFLMDLPVAYSLVEANNIFKLKLKNGEIIDVKIGAGEGEVLQIVVPMILLPFYHAGCSRILYQKFDNTYGIASPHETFEGAIEWRLKYNPVVNKVIHLPGGQGIDLAEKIKASAAHSSAENHVTKHHPLSKPHK